MRKQERVCWMDRGELNIADWFGKEGEGLYRKPKNVESSSHNLK